MSHSILFYCIVSYPIIYHTIFGYHPASRLVNTTSKKTSGAPHMCSGLGCCASSPDGCTPKESAVQDPPCAVNIFTKELQLQLHRQICYILLLCNLQINIICCIDLSQEPNRLNCDSAANDIANMATVCQGAVVLSSENKLATDSASLAFDKSDPVTSWTTHYHCSHEHMNTIDIANV